MCVSKDVGIVVDYHGLLGELDRAFSDNFFRVVAELEGGFARANAKLNALKNEFSKYESKNPELYKRISEMITLVLSDYRANRLDESEFYKRASDVVSEFVSASRDGASVLESNLASDFGDVVANELAKKIKELLAKPEYSHMDKETSKQALNELIPLLINPLKDIGKLNEIQTYANKVLTICQENG